MFYLNRANNYEVTLQIHAEKSFKESLALALSGLNIDYDNIDETDKNYFYSAIISGLGSANELIPFTSYKDNEDLSYVLQTLSQFMAKKHPSGSEFEVEIQIKIYNYLQEVMFNPADYDSVNKLESFIDSIK